MNLLDVTLLVAAPQLFLLFLCGFVLLCAACEKSARIWPYRLSILGLLVVACGTVYLFPQLPWGKPVVLFFGHLLVDRVGMLLQLSMVLVTLCSVMYARLYVRHRDFPQGEYYALCLFSLLGMTVLVSAGSFLSLYLGLELMSLPLYALVALRRDAPLGSEAAMKYFLMGAIASGMLLYGISMLYGVTNTIAFYPTAVYMLQALQQWQPEVIPMILGVVFIVAGVAFKLGAVPFHMWIPDVYEGAPNSVTLFIATAPKIAAVGLAFRLFGQTLGPMLAFWNSLLVILAVLSMAVGNIVALFQTDMKRLLGYSAIAHAGYLLLGFIALRANLGASGLSFDYQGVGAAIFYILVYGLTGLAAFGLLVVLSESADLEITKVDDLRGLHHRHPWLALMYLLALFSLAGIPPMLGFFAKFAIIQALVAQGFYSLAIIAMLFSVVGAYYYLRVVRVMYFEAADDTPPITVSRTAACLLSINGLAILVLGLFPVGLLMSVYQSLAL